MGRMPALARELIAARLDVVFCAASPGVRALMQETTTVPIVFVGISDPVELGFVKSLARPDTNATGFSSMYLALDAKRVQLLQELLPGMKRLVALMDDFKSDAREREKAVLQGSAEKLGVKLELWDIAEGPDFALAIAKASSHGAGAAYVLQSGRSFAYRKEIVAAAAKARLPVMYWANDFVDDGGLISYAVSIPGQVRQGAAYVDRILRGAKPAELPVQEPTIIELVISLKTAKALGITLPQSILLRADRVIE